MQKHSQGGCCWNYRGGALLQTLTAECGAKCALKATHGAQKQVGDPVAAFPLSVCVCVCVMEQSWKEDTCTRRGCRNTCLSSR